MRKLSLLVLAVVLLAGKVIGTPTPALAQADISPAEGTGPIGLEAVPKELQEWIPWVLADLSDYGCTTINYELQCSWPSTLALHLSETGGDFEQTVFLDRQRPFVLPGSTAQWPDQVTADGKPLAVLEINGLPTVVLPPGDHRVAGRFHWNQLPEGLDVPPEYAQIRLQIAGEEMRQLQRDENGRLWLKKQLTSAAQTEDRLTLEVFRKISDGVPMMVTTSIVVRSSGTPSEVTLQNVQLASTVPMTVHAELPARLTPEGHLKLQTRGGTYTVEIESIVKKTADSFSSDRRTAPWPQSEIWVFEPSEEIRQTEIGGLTGIDAARTNLKEEWKQLAAYVVSPGDTMQIRTTRRGESNPPPNRIVLHRKIWLDMDGKGYTVADNISGTLHRSTRLDMQKEGQLGHTRVNGKDQVITTNPGTKKAGVEIRHSNFDMRAESRIPARPGSLGAVGWETDVQELRTELNLPPGWNLITASGVDSIPGTWWDSWSLFGFFFVLLASIATARLTRWYFGVLALISLVLLHNEADIEVVAFIGLPLLIGLALLKALPASRLRIGVTIGWAFFALLLVAVAIPFSVDQIRQGLYPQLKNAYYAPMVQDEAYDNGETAWEETGGGQDMAEPAAEVAEAVNDEVQVRPDGMMMQAAPVPPPNEPMVKKTRSMPLSMLGSLGSSDYGEQQVEVKKFALQMDPEAVVQTGPGIPDWQWNTFELQWQGPVAKEQRIRLYITGPTLHLILGFVRVLFLAFLSVILILESFKSLKNPPVSGPSIRLPGKKSAATAAGLIAVLLCGSAKAEMPSDSRLEELKNRLARSPICTPDCVDTSELHIRVVDGQVAIQAVVNAGAKSAWPIPGPAANWVPQRVVLDGQVAPPMRLQPNGFIYVRLPEGVHTVLLEGAMKNESAFTLEFEDVPHRGSVSASGYTVDGMRADGHFETSIAISRLLATDSSFTETADSHYTPWLKVVRTFDFGIPWLIHTTVTRVSPPGTPLMFRIPLVKGETVTESNLETKNKKVVVALGRDETEVSWSSVLTETDSLTLVAPKGENWTESWQIRCSPIWQCDTSGIPPVDNRIEQKRYHPWPGESLRIATRRPKPEAGQTVTIDSAILTVSPGIRLTESSLALQLRASQGGVQKITLPSKSVVQSLLVDNSKRPFKQQQNTVEIALRPGKQKIVLQWQQQGGILAGYEAPRVQIGSPVANFHLHINMPIDRWLLAVSGPSFGPAILFWGYLLTILIVSFFILGRTSRGYLKGWQWALLSFGLTQVPIAMALVIVGWFFLMAFRGSNPMKDRLFVWHNLLQVGVGIFTFVALGCLIGAVYNGLAVQPDMQVSGLGSSNEQLHWYLDRIDGQTPAVRIWSIPILIWKGLMLAWSLWLSYSLIQWSRWGFGAFISGDIWRNPPPRIPAPKAAPTVTPTAPTPSQGSDAEKPR